MRTNSIEIRCRADLPLADKISYVGQRLRDQLEALNKKGKRNPLRAFLHKLYRLGANMVFVYEVRR